MRDAHRRPTFLMRVSICGLKRHTFQNRVNSSPSAICEIKTAPKANFSGRLWSCAVQSAAVSSAGYGQKRIPRPEGAGCGRFPIDE